MRKVVIGIGNPLKKDDNIGNLVVDELKKTIKNKKTLFIRGETNPENFVGKIKSFNPDVIYFIDAVEYDDKVGEVKVFSIDDVLSQTLSTHDISVRVFKDFFPNTKVYVIGIRPKSIGYGEGLSSILNDNFGNILGEIKKILTL